VNKAELRAQIKEYLDRPNMDDKIIDMWIKSAEGELARHLVDHPRNQRVAAHTHSGTVDADIIQLPTDLARIQQVIGPDRVRLPQYPIAYSPLDRHGFIYVGNAINIYPSLKPGQSITINYSRYLTPLERDIDDNWIAQYHVDIYLYGALKEASVYLKDDARLQLWQSEFLRRVENLSTQGWNESWQSAPQIHSLT
jgi:hypothetical protein